jgi:GNAT superfamily N-acetyltransferase
VPAADAEQYRPDAYSPGIDGRHVTGAGQVPGVRLRLAVPSDTESISALMSASVRALFPRYYDERQTASSVRYIARLDPALIDDGTYFVHEAAGEIVGCGGWSRRGRLYTGSGVHAGDDRVLDPATDAAHIRAMFVRPDWSRRGLGRAILDTALAAARAEGFTRLDLMATLPGVPLYRAFGFQEVERVAVTMPDGVAIEGVVMDRPIGRAAHPHES